MVSGAPAFEHKQWLRAVNAFSKLPELAKTVRSLARKQLQAESGKNEE
jgi:UDP-3-O-[3-hydroxymyristoyl] glucosamine N-acyltransferase